MDAVDLRRHLEGLASELQPGAGWQAARVARARVRATHLRRWLVRRLRRGSWLKLRVLLGEFLDRRPRLDRVEAEAVLEQVVQTLSSDGMVSRHGTGRHAAVRLGLWQPRSTHRRNARRRPRGMASDHDEDEPLGRRTYEA